jgi:hypothetical protein
MADQSCLPIFSLAGVVLTALPLIPVESGQTLEELKVCGMPAVAGRVGSEQYLGSE